jgi:flagellar biosynthetic protein FliS
MLYDGIIRFITCAIEKIKEGNIEERYNQLAKATHIIDALHASLDFKNGGTVAPELDKYYTSIYLRIMSVNTSNSVETLEQVLKEVAVMRDAWKEIDESTVNAEPKNLHLISDAMSSFNPEQPPEGGIEISA